MKRILIGVILGLALLGGPALAVEEPSFKLVAREGDFEIRDYPQLVVAEVRVSGDQNAAANRGFRKLAGYIFGGNTRRQSIAMTAPVAQSPASEKIAMTAPVAQTRQGSTWVVRFTMPQAYTLETLPKPNDPDVTLHAVPPTRFAILRFSGIANPGAVAEKSAELIRRSAAHRLHAIGPVTLAQYDPPWTLWFLRRNEVMLPVEP